MGFVTWYPNLRSDPPSDYSPVNRHTPILHLNGEEDQIVTEYAGKRTANELKTVFPRYTLDFAHGGHLSLLLKPNLPVWHIIRDWLGKHNLLGKYPGWNSNIIDEVDYYIEEGVDIIEEGVDHIEKEFYYWLG